MGIGTDAANFPSDFNVPAVIFLQDYRQNDYEFKEILQRRGDRKAHDDGE
jgi:hypothetical protein